MRKHLLKVALGLSALLGAFVALSGLASAEAVLPSQAQSNASSTTTTVEIATPGGQVSSTNKQVKDSALGSTHQSTIKDQTSVSKDLKIKVDTDESKVSTSSTKDQIGNEEGETASVSTSEIDGAQTSLSQEHSATLDQNQIGEPSGPALTNLNHSLQASASERSVQSMASRVDQAPPVAQSNHPAPSQPQPIQENGLFDKLSTALATSVLPTASHFFLDIANVTNPINHSLPLAGLTLLVLIVVVLDLFLCWLRKSGFHGAARSDGLPAAFTFATPIKVSFSSDNPIRNSLFSGLKINTSLSHRKEVIAI